MLWSLHTHSCISSRQAEIDDFAKETGLRGKTSETAEKDRQRRNYEVADLRETIKLQSMKTGERFVVFYTSMSRGKPYMVYYHIYARTQIGEGQGERRECAAEKLWRKHDENLSELRSGSF